MAVSNSELNTKHLPTVTPRLIATIPYSDFVTASESIYPFFAGVLTRGVRYRTFIIYNTLNVATNTAFSIFPYESTIIPGNPGGVASGVSWGSGLGTGAMFVLDSRLDAAGNGGLLAAMVDSFQAGVGVGATLPTSGSITIYVVEE